MSQIMSVLVFTEFATSCGEKNCWSQSRKTLLLARPEELRVEKYVGQQPNSLNRTGFLVLASLANRGSLRSFVSQRNADLKHFVRKWPCSSLPQNFPRSLLPSSLHKSPYVGLVLIGNQHTWSTVGLTSSVKVWRTSPSI